MRVGTPPVLQMAALEAAQIATLVRALLILTIVAAIAGLRLTS